MNSENVFLNRVVNKMKNRTSCLKNMEGASKIFDRRTTAVRFETNIEVFEIDSYRNFGVSENMLWYSQDDIDQMFSTICDFVRELRNEKICDYYNDDSLEFLFMNTDRNSHLLKQEENEHTIQGIESMIDGNKERRRMKLVKEGVKAVLREQTKQKRQQSWSYLNKKDINNNSRNIEAIAECYRKEAHTIECQLVAQTRGMKYFRDTLFVKKIPPRKCIRATPIVRNTMKRNRGGAAA